MKEHNPGGTGLDETSLLAHVIGSRAIRTVFQPVVDIDSGTVVAFEALTRGPKGSALERPDLLFAAARRAGRLIDLDVACRVSALSSARAGGLLAPYQLLINAEPDALDGWRPDVAADGRAPSVILELTERELAARPAQLLQTVARVRSFGWGIALDDVGAVPESLALLPLVRPDIIKLDLSLVQDRPSRDIAAVMNAVHAEAERSGTLLLAEGIETEEHLVTARAFGATLGQGWYFGRPAPLPDPLPEFSGPRPVSIVPRGDNVPSESPFQLASALRNPRPADKRLLIEVSKHLEAQARNAGECAVVLAAFQDARFFTEATRERYRDLAGATAFVGALGEDMPPQPLPGVRGAVLTPGDPLRGEWDIAVLGPHFAACLTARDLGDTGPDLERRFEFVLSHDRELTTNVASALMSRIWPEPRTTDLPRLPDPASVRLPSPAQPAEAVATSAVASVGDLPPHVGVAAAAGLLGAQDGWPVDLDVSSSLLHRALEAATTGITIADVRHPDSPLIWVNPAFSELSGYPVAEVLERNCRFLQGPGTDPRTVAEIRDAIEHGRETRVRVLNYRKDGSPWWNDLHLCPVVDASAEVTHYVGVQNDVTARVEAEDRVLHLAYHDALTGLPNRGRLAESLGQALQRGAAAGSATALLFLDFDDFKQVNDEHGHAAGDELLRAVAARLRGAVRGDNLVARQGGDEFLLLLADLPVGSAEQIAGRVADGVLASLSDPFRLSIGKARVGGSIGVAIAPEDGASVGDLLRRADTAMYAAKEAGGGVLRRWRP